MSRESYHREFDQQSRLQARQGYMRIDTHRPIWIGCSGGCEQSKKACDCEISNAAPLRASFPIRPAITVYRISRWALTKRFARDVLAWLGARNV